VDRPTEDIDGCQSAHSRLAAAINDLPDAVVRQPSLLPDWTVGHVLTHLARNTEAMVRRVEAATRGELIDQYPGGARGRAAEIEAGADRPAHELITDVRNWAQRLDAVGADGIRVSLTVGSERSERPTLPGRARPRSRRGRTYRWLPLRYVSQCVARQRDCAMNAAHTPWRCR
jgi:uncharacterized protein (TIGR03083 family)